MKMTTSFILFLIGSLVTGFADSWAVKMGLTTARHGTTGAAACNAFFVIDGNSGGGENETFDPAVNIWRHRTHDPVSRTAVACAVVDNKIYVIGGTSNSTTNNMYDPNTDTWTLKAPMPTGRYDLACVALNNKIYAIGGTGGNNVMEVYDPQTNTWATCPSMPHPRTGLGAAVINGKIYAIGGDGGGFVSYNDVYDTTTHTWSTAAPMPTARGYMVCVAMDSVLYSISGYSGGNHVTTNEMYDPRTNTWQTKAPILVPRKGPGSAVLRNKIYVAAGSNSEYLTECEEYTPDGYVDAVEEEYQAVRDRNDYYARMDSRQVWLNFTGDLGQPVRVVLYDVCGRIVDEWRATSSRMVNLKPGNAGNYAGGVYLISVISPETRITKKIVCSM